MTDVRCEPTETRVHVDGTQTSVQIDLVDIYTTYYWISHAQVAPEHRAAHSEEAAS